MTNQWVKQGTLLADGKSLEYRCFGPTPAEAPTIVLLHEGLGCAELWRDFPQKLSDATGLGVMAYSRAGYGQSDPADLPRPLNYMSLEATNVLPQVLDAINFERGILLGHSDGATIAAIYAGSVIDHRVRGIALMAPHFFTEDFALEEIAKAKDYYESGLRERMAKYHANPDNAFRGWNDSWLHPDFKDWNVSEVIDYWRIPVLAIQGREDQYGTLAQITEIEDRCYAPVDTCILDDCRHTPFQDQPQQVLDALTEFVARIERIDSSDVAVGMSAV